MKTRLSFCLWVILCVLCAAASAAPGDTVLYPPQSMEEQLAALEAGGEEAERQYVSSVAIRPERVYALVDNAWVTRWRPGEEAPEKLFQLPFGGGVLRRLPQ